MYFDESLLFAIVGFLAGTIYVITNQQISVRRKRIVLGFTGALTPMLVLVTNAVPAGYLFSVLGAGAFVLIQVLVFKFIDGYVNNLTT